MRAGSTRKLLLTYVLASWREIRYRPRIYRLKCGKKTKWRPAAKGQSTAACCALYTIAVVMYVGISVFSFSFSFTGSIWFRDTFNIELSTSVKTSNKNDTTRYDFSFVRKKRKKRKNRIGIRTYRSNILGIFFNIFFNIFYFRIFFK